MLNSEQIQQLQELSKDWRKKHYGTGDASYDNGQESARDCCADALDELIDSFQNSRRPPMHVVDLKTKPMSLEDFNILGEW